MMVKNDDRILKYPFKYVLEASILMNMQKRVTKTEGCNSRLVGRSFPRLPRKPQGHNKQTNSVTDAANHSQMGNMLQI